MKSLLGILFTVVIISALNIIMLIKWIVPVIFSNMDNGYYDAFSLISVLCGNNPDDSVLHYLNYSDYNGVLFFIFMTPGILVSWLTLLTLYKLILWDAPLSVFGFSTKAITEVIK